MTRPDQPPPDPPAGDPSAGRLGDDPPSWMGAPAYSPYPDHLPPHAPMPGAPPYPPAAEHPPPPVGARRPRTGFGRALAASAVWAAVNLLLVLLIEGAPGSARAVGLLAAGLVTWLLARRRTWPFWLLAAAAAPTFWILRALSVAVAGS